jgi:hypothetical protein
MIRNLLALIGLAFVLFVIVGKVMGWYTYSRQDGKLTLNIFTDKVEEGLQQIKDNAVKALTKPDDATKTAQPPQEEKGLRSIFGPAVPRTQPQQSQPPANQTSGIPASLQLPASGR